MSSTDRNNQNVDANQPNTQLEDRQPENKGLLESVGETLSHAKDQLVGAWTKNEEAVKEEYHQNRAENADTLVDQAKHKGQEWQHGAAKNVEAMKEEYHDKARQVNQDSAMEKIENTEQPKGLIQSAVDTLSSVKDQIVSSFDTNKESDQLSNERRNDASDIPDRSNERRNDASDTQDRPNERRNDSSDIPDRPKESEWDDKGLMDSLTQMKDEFIASFDKNKEAVKEEYYKQKSDNDDNLMDQAKDKAKEWGHGIQKNTESVKQDFHSGDEFRNDQSAVDKLSDMKDKASATLNKNIEAGKAEYYSNKADNSSTLVDQAKNKGKEWQHNFNKGAEAAKEEFHVDA